MSLLSLLTSLFSFLLAGCWGVFFEPDSLRGFLSLGDLLLLAIGEGLVSILKQEICEPWAYLSEPSSLSACDLPRSLELHPHLDEFIGDVTMLARNLLDAISHLSLGSRCRILLIFDSILPIALGVNLLLTTREIGHTDLGEGFERVILWPDFKGIDETGLVVIHTLHLGICTNLCNWLDLLKWRIAQGLITQLWALNCVQTSGHLLHHRCLEVPHLAQLLQDAVHQALVSLIVSFEMWLTRFAQICAIHPDLLKATRLWFSLLSILNRVDIWPSNGNLGSAVDLITLRGGMILVIARVLRRSIHQRWTHACCFILPKRGLVGLGCWKIQTCCLSLIL